MQPSSRAPRAPLSNPSAAVDARYVRMTSEPVSRLVAQLAVPTIISMLVTALYNMADTYFVGKINTAATAAVGVVFPLMTTIQVIGMTIGVGSGSYVARLLGQKNLFRANQSLSTGFFTALMCGVIFTVIGELFATPLTRLLGATPTILPYAKDYARLVVLGAPFMAAAFVMNVSLRSEGSAVLAMMGLVSGAVINIALDPLFIFTFRLGVAGAALATVVSQMASFAILISHYLQGRSTLRLRFTSFLPEWAMYREILRSGLPTFARQSLVTIAAIILNKAAGQYGDAAIAGMTVANRITIFIGSALIGFGQGFQPVAAFNYAAGFFHRVHKAFWFSVKVGATALLLCALVTISFAPTLIRLFRNDPVVIEIGALALRLQAITMPLNAFIVIANMMFQYIGKARKALILAISRQGMLFVPAILILSRVFGLRGIQMSQAVADGLSFLLAIPLSVATLRLLARGQPEPGTPPSTVQAVMNE